MLGNLLSPRAIAIIGASKEARRPGGHALRALTQYGYAGDVFAVNPRYQEINGRACYPSVSVLPKRCDLAIIAVPAAEVPGTLEECGKADIRHAVIFSSGFREIGETGAALQARLEEAIRRSGVRVVGPNCIGVLNVPKRVFAGFGAVFRDPRWRGGPAALISQSGGFAYSIVALCREAGLGFDYLVSTGNETDLGTLDFVEHFLQRDEIRLIAVFLEGIGNGRRLRDLGRRALEAGKPIAVWKVGNTSTGKQAAVSHTANLTEDYDFYRDAFREGGFIEVREVYDLIDAAKVFRPAKWPKGKSVAIVTTSGGAGVLLADRCEEAGLNLSALTERSVTELKTLLPDFASTANPIDLTAELAQIQPQFSKACEIVTADPNIDEFILRSFPGGDVVAWAERLKLQAAACAKPVLVSLSGTPGQAVDWAPALEEAGVPCFEAPGRAAAAAAALCDFSARCARFGQRKTSGRIIEPRKLPAEGAATLDEHQAKACLEAYGIPTPRRVFVPADQADALDKVNLVFPLVAKVVSPGLAHKTEAGAVRLGIRDVGELGTALPELRANATAYNPRARIRGFLLEEMAEGLEIIVGALSNESFGPLVIVGMGGVHAELFRDVARRFAPFGVDEAREMILSLKAGRLLQGYRNQPARDIDALCELISRISLMIADHAAALSEIEINPVMVGAVGRGARAVDAIVRFRNEPRVP